MNFQNFLQRLHNDRACQASWREVNKQTNQYSFYQIHCFVINSKTGNCGPNYQVSFDTECRCGKPQRDNIQHRSSGRYIYITYIDFLGIRNPIAVKVAVLNKSLNNSNKVLRQYNTKMRHSITAWNLAKSPNYETNINKIYPYSEVPYIGNYKLVKLPIEGLLEHVDYWGEGKITVKEGTSGYPDCYNVNHQYQLVSNGPDRDRKIPNRIPVISYTNCDTYSYVKNNSVRLVTLMGAPINKSCATDIARMVNDREGKVIVFGFDSNCADIKNLNEALIEKGLIYCPSHDLSENITVTLFGKDDHRAYLNLTDLEVEFYRNITLGKSENAVDITKSLDNSSNTSLISSFVTKLLKEGNKNLMSYAYKLWNADGKELVKSHFPVAFKLVFNEDFVKLINKKHMLALSVDVSTECGIDKVVKGDSNDKSSEKVRWKFIPVTERNDMLFKLVNVQHNSNLKLDSSQYNNEERIAKASDETDSSSLWYLEPKKIDDDMIFYIINRQYNQGLKLGDTTDTNGDRQLYGHNKPMSDQTEDEWFIAPWP